MFKRFCYTLTLFISIRAFSQNAMFLYPGGSIHIQPGSHLVLKGRAVLSNGSSIINEGDIHISNTSRSYWIDSSYLTGSMTGTGKVYFDGTSQIDISGNNIFYDAIVNGSSISMDSSSVFSVTHQLYFQKGIIYTNNTALKILNENENAIAADANNPNYSRGWVMGKLSRKIGVNTFSYDFPVGDSTNVHPATLLNNNLAGVNELTLYFGAKKGNDAGLHVVEGFNYVGLHDRGIWYVDPKNVSIGGSFSLRLSLNGFTGLLDNQFGILSRSYFSSDAKDWVIPAGSSLPANGTSGRIVSAGFAQRNFITALSATQFGIGFTTSPLPVRLIDLKAERINHIVQLSWATVSESRNNGFIIEKENGAGDFTSIGFIASKALLDNSANRLDYLFSDGTAHAKINRYRLKQINNDGSFVYSKVVSIAAEKGFNLVYPNPTKDQIYVRMFSTGNYELAISNSEGRIVKKQRITENANLHLSGFTNGYYTVTITDANNEKVLIQKILLLKD